VIADPAELLRAGRTALAGRVLNLHRAGKPVFPQAVFGRDDTRHQRDQAERGKQVGD
jgi:hypothetical protein